MSHNPSEAIRRQIEIRTNEARTILIAMVLACTPEGRQPPTDQDLDGIVRFAQKHEEDALLMIRNETKPRIITVKEKGKVFLGFNISNSILLKSDR